MHQLVFWILSPTRNVVQMLLALALLVFLLIKIAGRYKKGEGIKTAPTGWQNTMETVINFIDDEICKPNLGAKSKKYLPYILTVFLFILINNIIWFNTWLGQRYQVILPLHFSCRLFHLLSSCSAAISITGCILLILQAFRAG